MSGPNPIQQLMKGTFVLALAAFLSKLLGVIYKIPYQNITQDMGFYVYEQVYPIYMILLTLATAGVPVAISKLVAERLAYQDHTGARKVFKAATLLLTLTGFLFFSALFLGAPLVAAILYDPQLTLAIQSVSFALLVVPVMAAIRGYFQGHQNMVPTAVSQVVEQIVRVATILWLSYWLISNQYDAYHAGAGAVFGAFTGAVAALVVLLIYWRKNKRSEAAATVEQPASEAGEKVPSYQAVGYWTIIRKIVAYAVPISLGALVLPLFQLMDSLTIPHILTLSGWEHELAKNERGVYARGHPLVQFAAFFATALSLALVPSISEAKAQNKVRQIVSRTQVALKVTFLVGLGAAVGLAVLARPINVMFYITDAGSTTISVLAFVTIFSTLSMTSGAVLQGMGYVTLPARHLFIGVGVKSILNIALLPFFGITGAALASVAGYFTAASLNIRTLRRMLPLPGITGQAVWRPAVAVLIMGAVVWMVKGGLFVALDGLIGHERLLNLAVTLLSIPVGVFVYGLFLLRLNMITRQELAILPRGERLIRLLEKLKIIRKER